MSQNRNAPAYQEYAANILAQLPFRTISLQDRGLLWTMRMECWVNKQLPNNPDVIAKALGLPVDEVVSSLPAVMSFFKIEGDFIVCPELENYREHLEARSKKLSKSGKKGADITNKKRTNKSVNTISNDMSATPTATPSATLQPPRRGSDGLLVQLSTVQHSQVQSIEKELTKDSFVKEMEEYEASENNANDMVEF